MATIAEFLAMVGFETDKRSMQAAFKQVATFGAAIAGVAAGAVAGLLKIAESEAKLADDSQKLGLPAEKLEELRFVADQTGTSTEALAQSLQGLKKANPGIKDTSRLLEKAGRTIQNMNDAAAEAYAKKMGIDPGLIPMLRQDVARLAGEYKELYTASGRNAAQAAADGKAVMQEFGKLKSIAELVMKSVGGAFLGRIRRSIELLRKTVMENFHKIKSTLEIFIGFVLRIGNVIAAFVYRIIKFASSIINWFSKLYAGQKKIVIGLGLILAAWKLLSAGFLASPLGMVVAALTAILLLVDDYLTFMEGGKSYFDWNPFAETISAVKAAIIKVIDAIKDFYKGNEKLVNGTGKGIAAAIALKGIIITVTTAFKFFGTSVLGVLNVFKLLWGILRANPLGIIITLAALVIEYWEPIKEFFAHIWEGIAENFPDFAAWASKAASSIREIFGKVVGWLKDKLRSITKFLPDFVKKKLGLADIPEEIETDTSKAETKEPEKNQPIKSDTQTNQPEKNTAIKPNLIQPVAMPKNMPNIRPVPTGPMLRPSPMAAAQSVNNNTEIKVESKTQITVNGTQNPEAVAGKVNSAQKGVAADIARHTQGAIK